MTRALNIEKMKRDAARAILDTLDSEDYINMKSIPIEDIRKIDRNQLEDFTIEQLHAILGRLTPDSS